jgi:Alw26I/Eco31I/Esp3I family type II restriction m6 adenine DNA methyltransferase
MTYEQIHNLFKQRYNQANWKQFLGQAFAKSRLLATPELLTGIDSNVASQVQKLGYITLNENGIERQIAVYEVTLAQGIILERNRVGLRNLLRKYWKDIDAAFIAYHRPESPKWRFTYVSELTGYDADGEFVKIKTEPKRYTYVLGEGESTRTAAERFTTIASKGNKANLDDVKEAFSVEKLSKAFFDEYKKHYDIFCDFMVSKPNIRQTIFNGDEKGIRDFNKKLLGRIVFLYFIQKKGWLGVPSKSDWGKGDFDFLTNLFKNTKNPDLFYSELLSKLFFDSLNTKRKDDLIELVKGEPCRIPYLNGGLFEEDDKKHRNLIFPANLFKSLFDFFNQYNFTIYEDDPNDHTVAVDPEMLGHIFENLLEDNKDKGAFYTPKEIVHYMCQESLIEYLTTWFENKGYEVVGHSIIGKEDKPELFPINEGRKGQLAIETDNQAKGKQIDRLLIEKLLKKKLDDDDKKLIKKHSAEFHTALDSVKICDPAIGSGAFPMGLLNEIFTAKQTLHNFDFGNTKDFKASAVKLNIIQNSIYGVDIEKGAVDIARLRFWLSLIVDKEKPKALPNLDYKIVVGNSLVSKLNDDIIDIDWTLNETSHGLFGADLAKQKGDLLKMISKEQKEFFSPNSNKKKLSTDIRKLKIDLLITQLELMITTKGLDKKPSGTGKATTKQTEIYLQTLGWKGSIKDLQKLKNKPEIPLQFFDWKLDFPEVMNEYITDKVGFDIVIANPPYDVFEGKKKVEIEGLLTFDIYHKCKGGKINAYELFLAKTDELLKNGGTNCQIFQNSFLADNSSKGVRNHYLNNQSLLYIESFPERDDITKRVFESAKMSVCILMSKKIILSDYKFSLRIHSDRTLKKYYIVEFNKSEIISFDPINVVIPTLQKEDKVIFTRYNKSENLEKYSAKFECIEGELNMTFHKSYMTSDVRKPLIVKGAQIQRYFVTKNPSQGQIEYVDKKRYLDDYSNSKKSLHHKVKRIALQGISGANDKVRLISTIIDENIFCANSCNYIISKVDNKTVSIYTLLGIFNSKLTNWIFRKTSTNSNVNCYEVNNLKIPLELNKFNKPLEKLVKNILDKKSKSKDTLTLEQEIDNLVYKIYKLSYDEVKVIDPEFSLSKTAYEAIKLE